MLIAWDKFKSRFQLSLILCSVLAFGCNPVGTPQLRTAKVQGLVLLDGLPLDQAKVVFLPTKLTNNEESIMQLAYGTTNAEGEFELEYSDGTKELVAGFYTVIISKVNKEPDSEVNRNEPWPTSLLPESIADLTAFSSTGETIRPIYNRDSKLTCKVTASTGIFRARFGLTSMDPARPEGVDAD